MTIPVCPECDDADVYTRRPTTQAAPSDGYTYRCQACDARFDKPNYRERRSSAASLRKNTLARRLLNADPDEVGP